MRRRRPHPYNQEDADDQVPYHWECTLLEWERQKLLDLLDLDRKPTIQERRWLAKRLKDGIRRDGPPLPLAQLDWRQAEREARERRESVADWIWDRPRPPEVA